MDRQSHQGHVLRVLVALLFFSLQAAPIGGEGEKIFASSRIQVQRLFFSPIQSIDPDDIAAGHVLTIGTQEAIM